MSVILYEKVDNIGIITLNRPEKHNALTPDLLRELEAAMFEFMEDPELYVGIITGAGQKAFCAGADIKEMLPFITLGAAIVIGAGVIIYTVKKKK